MAASSSMNNQKDDLSKHLYPKFDEVTNCYIIFQRNSLSWTYSFSVTKKWQISEIVKIGHYIERFSLHGRTRSSNFVSTWLYYHKGFHFCAWHFKKDHQFLIFLFLLCIKWNNPVTILILTEAHSHTLGHFFRFCFHSKLKWKDQQWEMNVKVKTKRAGCMHVYKTCNFLGQQD